MTRMDKIKSAIEANNLSKKYGELLAVDNISFKVKEGEIFGFLGPNGLSNSKILCMILYIKNRWGNWYKNILLNQFENNAII